MTRMALLTTHMEAAIAEVRFVPGREDLPEAAARAVWAAVGQERFTVFDRHSVNAFNVTVTPKGPETVTQVQHGWLLATADRRTTITLLPAMVAVQTADYVRYRTSIADLLGPAVEEFVRATGSELVQRIGVRYINRLQDPAATTPMFWSDRVRPEYGGPLSGDAASKVVSTHQQTMLRLESNAGATVNTGVFRDEGADAHYSFLIDLDVYREHALVYESETCANLTRQLNRTALALFYQILTEDHFATMGPVGLENGGE
jgi:uncharacterized protein (TIGR04255 family)